jgi:hypothetical protein
VDKKKALGKEGLLADRATAFPGGATQQLPPYWLLPLPDWLLLPDWPPDCEPPERCVDPPLDWLPDCEDPPERFMEPDDEPCEREDEPWLRPTVEDEPLVFCCERTVVRLFSRERTLARTFTSPPERLLTVVRLDSPLIATLGCRFLIMVVRLVGSDVTRRLRFFLMTTFFGACFFLITTFEGR